MCIEEERLTLIEQNIEYWLTANGFPGAFAATRVEEDRAFGWIRSRAFLHYLLLEERWSRDRIQTAAEYFHGGVAEGAKVWVASYRWNGRPSPQICFHRNPDDPDNYAEVFASWDFDEWPARGWRAIPHGLLEVLPHAVRKTKTDQRKIADMLREAYPHSTSALP